MIKYGWQWVGVGGVEFWHYWCGLSWTLAKQEFAVRWTRTICLQSGGEEIVIKNAQNCSILSTGFSKHKIFATDKVVLLSRVCWTGFLLLVSHNFSLGWIYNILPVFCPASRVAAARPAPPRKYNRMSRAAAAANLKLHISS